MFENGITYSETLQKKKPGVFMFEKINPREIFEKWLFAKINPSEINFKNSSAKLQIGMG